MSRILFVMLHPGFIRYFDDAIQGLAAQGHDVHVAFEISRTKLGEDQTARRLAEVSPRLTCGTAPTRAESVRAFLARADRTATRSGGAARSALDSDARAEAWESLATTVRLMLDYLRYFEPVFAGATALRGRAEKRLPRVYRSLVALMARGGRVTRRALAAVLDGFERVIPANPEVDAFLREQRPDLLLVTPLIELGSQQVDYVKSARRQGIRSALCVASWDNLTSKGLIRSIPDHVIVWNEAQKDEAVTLHGVRPEQVTVTGAQLFDRWFAAKPSRSREEFCRMVSLDPARPFVLYVGSSVFIAPDEVPFAERWLSRLRHAGSPAMASMGVLVRPHPANAAQWRALAPAREGLAVWPPIGTDPTAPDFARDFYDSLYYSAAVVGINTSAQIEAGIVGRPVFTIRAREFEHSQDGTLHFRHLVRADGGLVRSADSLDEHVAQLTAALDDGGVPRDANRRFLESFVRPGGIDAPAVPTFVQAVAEIAARSQTPRPEPLWVRAARRPAFIAAWIARQLADDRPLWVYLLRPFITLTVWLAAVKYFARDAWHERGYPGVRRAFRSVHRSWYESQRTLGKSLGKSMHRLRKRTTAVMRGAARRLAGRSA